MHEEDFVIISSHSFLNLLRSGLIDIPTHVVEGGDSLSELPVSLDSPEAVCNLYSVRPVFLGRSELYFLSLFGMPLDIWHSSTQCKHLLCLKCNPIPFTTALCISPKSAYLPVMHSVLWGQVAH